MITALFQGTFAGIIIGLTQLNCSELKLRRLCYRQGYVHSCRISCETVALSKRHAVLLSSVCEGLPPTQVCLSFFAFRLLGVDKLFSFAINEWLNDIKKNQLPGILGGVGPIHSLVQLGE